MRTFAQLELIGVNRDLPAYRVEPTRWTDVENVNARDGVNRRIRGYESVFGIPAEIEPLWLTPVLTATSAFWLYAAKQGLDYDIYVTDGANNFKLTAAPITLSSDINQFTGAGFNGVPLINWQDEAPVYWDLTTNPGSILTLPGWEAGAKCGALRAFRNYIVALDYTDGGGSRIDNLIRWSDAAEPGTLPITWTPDTTNDAGFLSAAETSGPVIDAVAVRDRLLVFKNNSTYALTYIGGAFVFDLRLLFDSVGALTRNCAVEFGGNALVVTPTDVVVTDGYQVRSVADRRVQRELFSDIDTFNRQRVHCVHYRARREIWVMYPQSGSTWCNRAAIWDYEANEWTFRDLADVSFAAEGVAVLANVADYASQTQSYAETEETYRDLAVSAIDRRLLLADVNERLVLVDAGNRGVAGGDIRARLERVSVDFDEPHTYKTVRAIWPRITGSAGTPLQISVGAQRHPDDAIRWSAPVEFVIGRDEKVDVKQVGRYLSFRFETLGGDPWEMTGFGVEFGAIKAKY